MCLTIDNLYTTVLFTIRKKNTDIKFLTSLTRMPSSERFRLKIQMKTAISPLSHLSMAAFINSDVTINA